MICYTDFGLKKYKYMPNNIGYRKSKSLIVDFEFSCLIFDLVDKLSKNSSKYVCISVLDSWDNESIEFI